MAAQKHPRTALIEALQAGHQEAALDSFRELVRREPEQWQALLLVDGAVYAPSHQDFPTRSVMLLAILSRLGPDEPPTLDERMEFFGLLGALSLLAQGYRDIRQKLDAPQLWTASRATWKWRLAALLQGEFEKNARFLNNAAVTPHGFDTIAAMRAVVPLEGETGFISAADATESLVDAVDLVLRFRLQARNDEEGELDTDASPAGAGELRKVLRLAQIWRAYDYIWERVRYQGWRPVVKEKETVWVPRDMDRFKLARIGELREQVVMHSLVLPLTTSRAHARRQERYRKAFHALAADVKLPSAGLPWDMDLDMSRLEYVVSEHSHSLTADSYIRFRHLGPVLEHFEKHAGARWETWLKVSQGIHALADLLRWATGSLTSAPSATANFPVIVTRERLTKVIAETTGLDVAEVVCGLSAITFDVKRKHLDLRDQPLIPLGPDRFLLSPGLVSLVNPVMFVEHTISRIQDAVFSRRGTPFERAIAWKLAQSLGLPVASTIKFQASDGLPLELDVLTFWQGHLLLIETKCVKGIAEPAQEYKAWAKVEEAFDQLDRRRRLLRTDWKILREKAREKKVNLPESPPNDENVISIVVVNELPFTSIVRSSSVVADEFCLLRYFGRKEVEVISTGPGLRQRRLAGQIRQEEVPTPQGLLRYLRDPPQLRALAKHLRLTGHRLPAYDDSLLLVAVLEFDADGAASALDPFEP
ncbi:hypothetical protein D7Y27_38660 [Corallococcus sp. AB004]|nr:hypothetical protein D7Y27_38660 [Corallococcus sp. AB004]